MPKIGPNDVLIKVRKTAICGTDMHIYNWDDWAQKTIPVPMVVGHEYVRRDRRGRAARCRASRSATASPARATSPAATAATAAPAAATSAATRSASASTARAASPSTWSIPAFNAFKLPRRDHRRDRLDPRPVRQRDAHRALVRPGRRGRADHRRRPDRHHGRRPSPATSARATSSITDVNDYRLELARKMGATRAVNVSRESLDRTR